MANGRDTEKMKMVATFVTKEFKSRIEKAAKKRGITVSELIREKLKEEMGEPRDVGTQTKPRRK